MNKNAFYNMKSINKLKSILYVDDFEFINNYRVYIIKNRIIQIPFGKLEKVHSRIFKLLKKNSEIYLPDYIISKKGKSWSDNARVHKSSNHFYLIDLAKFYPSIERSKIFYFFLHKMNTSLDVANILADIISIDMSKIKLHNEVIDWIERTNKSLGFRLPPKHLPTGSPVSQLISLNSNLDMFEEINCYSKRNKIIMSVYVDDITLSSNYNISIRMRKKIDNIIKQNGYVINEHKKKVLNKNTENIQITGSVIKRGTTNISPRNNLTKKVIDYINNIENDRLSDNQILGILNTIKQVSYNDYEFYKKLIKKNIILKQR